MKENSKPEALNILFPILGKKIIRIDQIFYVYKGEVDKTDCFLQFFMEDQTIFHLTTGGDGESLIIKANAWIDYFAEPLDPINSKYVLEHGKWTLFDVSEEPIFKDLINKELTDVKPIVDYNNKLRGLELCIGDQYLCYIVNGDEGFVVWGKSYEGIWNL